MTQRSRKTTAIIVAALSAFVVGGIATLVMALGHPVTVNGSTASDSMGHRPANTAILLGQFKGTIESFTHGDALGSTGFSAGDRMIDTFGSGSRTVCVPGRITDPLDTITLCGSNAPTPNPCVAEDPSGNTFDLFVEPCNAVATLWSQLNNGCPPVQFINHHFAGRAIAMDGHAGDVAIGRVPPIPGWYYNMFPVPVDC